MVLITIIYYQYYSIIYISTTIEVLIVMHLRTIIIH